MILTPAGAEAKHTNGYTQFTHLAVGTGTQTEAESVTALATELDRIAIGGYDPTDFTLLYETLFSNAEGVGTITEMGFYDASSGGNLLAYHVFASAIVKAANEALLISVSEVLANAS